MDVVDLDTGSPVDGAAACHHGTRAWTPRAQTRHAASWTGAGDLMGWFWPDEDLSDADLLRYCAWQESLRPQLLAELSTWLEQTWDPARHGPRSALDGRLGSLTPLMSWVFDFGDAGMPGIPETVHLMNWAPPQDPPEPGLGARLGYAALAVESYMVAVIRRYDPSAQWRPVRTRSRIPAGDERRPSLHVHGHPVTPNIATALSHAVEPDPYSPRVEPEWLLEDIVASVPQAVVEQDLPPAPDLLPPPGRQTPAQPWPPFQPTQDVTPEQLDPALPPRPRPVGAEQAPALPELAGADFLMTRLAGEHVSVDGFYDITEIDADGRDDEEQYARFDRLLDTSAPLSTRGLHRALLGLGFEYEGEGTPRLDRVDVQYTFVGQEAALLGETHRAGGRLRSLHFSWLTEPGRSPDTPTGRWLVQQLAELAAGVDAVLLAAEPRTS